MQFAVNIPVIKFYSKRDGIVGDYWLLITFFAIFVLFIFFAKCVVISLLHSISLSLSLRAFCMKTFLTLSFIIPWETSWSQNLHLQGMKHFTFRAFIWPKCLFIYLCVHGFKYILLYHFLFYCLWFYPFAFLCCLILMIFLCNKNTVQTGLALLLGFLVFFFFSFSFATSTGSV